MIRSALAGGFALALAASGLGCGDGETQGETGGGTPGGTTSSGTGTGGGGGGGGGSVGPISCSSTPPPGATLAPELPVYGGGACPMLVPGMNTITSANTTRMFILAVPADIDPAEPLPVIFLWHWLGGSADDFYTRGDVQAAVDQQRFIAVIPESLEDVQFQWPFSTIDSDARMEEEFVFFDDMLACVSEQFKVNKECVSSAGVSAGALFTDQLAGGRGQHLSSILSLSGGVGGVVKPWKEPSHKMPAMVLWGGPTDQCFGVLNFQDASHNLEAGLTSGGHFFIECVHNCGHAAPPLDVPAGVSAFAPLWQFVLDHPYWLNDGESSYLKDGLPELLPTWCGIGADSATPRTGTCPDPPGC